MADAAFSYLGNKYGSRTLVDEYVGSLINTLAAWQLVSSFFFPSLFGSFFPNNCSTTVVLLLSEQATNLTSILGALLAGTALSLHAGVMQNVYMPSKKCYWLISWTWLAGCNCDSTGRGAAPSCTINACLYI